MKNAIKRAAKALALILSAACLVRNRKKYGYA